LAGLPTLAVAPKANIVSSWSHWFSLPGVFLEPCDFSFFPKNLAVHVKNCVLCFSQHVWVIVYTRIFKLHIAQHSKIQKFKLHFQKPIISCNGPFHSFWVFKKVICKLIFNWLIKIVHIYGVQPDCFCSESDSKVY
jgi:hypothetical protein